MSCISSQLVDKTVVNPNLSFRGAIVEKPRLFRDSCDSSCGTYIGVPARQR